MTLSSVLRFLYPAIFLYGYSAIIFVAYAQSAAGEKYRLPTSAQPSKPTEQGAGLEQGRVWIDVRSWPEHLIDSIAGDMHIHYPDLVDEVRQRFPDTATPIALYCAAGVRAERARQSLIAAGYADVVNAGSLAAAREQRGLD